MRKYLFKAKNLATNRIVEVYKVSVEPGSAACALIFDPSTATRGMFVVPCTNLEPLQEKVPLNEGGCDSDEE